MSEAPVIVSREGSLVSQALLAGIVDASVHEVSNN